MSNNPCPEISPSTAAVANTPSPDPSAQTVLGALTAWAKERRKWLETSVFQATSLRRNLTDSELEIVYDVLEVECALKESGALTTSVIQPTVAVASAFRSLSLRELAGVQNVNALTSGQRLIFHEKLTIFFGETAAASLDTQEFLSG